MLSITKSFIWMLRMHPLRVMALYANDKLSYRIVSTDKEWRKRGASCVSGKCVYCKKTPATRWYTRSAYDRTEDGGVYRSTSSGRVGWSRRVGVSSGRVGRARHTAATLEPRRYSRPTRNRASRHCVTARRRRSVQSRVLQGGGFT